MCNISKGTGVDKGRCSFQSLNEIGTECIFQKRRHGPSALELFRRHRLPVRTEADDNAVQAATKEQA